MNIVIVGGGYAGLACAVRLARRMRQQGTHAQVKLVSPEPVLIERIRLHQRAAGQLLPARRIDSLLRRLGVQHVAASVNAIDLQAHTVQAGPDSLHWDRLVLATGSYAGVPRTCSASDAVYNLNAESAAALHRRLKSLPAGARLVVVGGGLTGIEAASELAESFPQLQIALVCSGQLAADFSPKARRYFQQTLEKLGVQLHEQVNVQRVDNAHLISPSGDIGFDVCVWACGLQVGELPRQAGLSVNARGQVLVDPQLRSVSHPTVYAAGDVVAPVLPPGQPLPMGCKAALPAGAHVGDNLACELKGSNPLPFDFALTLYSVSLGRRAGLVQWPDTHGQLRGGVITGRLGAVAKELICRSTWWSLVWEARGWPGIFWMHTGRAPEALAGGISAMPERP